MTEKSQSLIERMWEKITEDGPTDKERLTTRWNSVDILEGDEYDQPMVLQQRILPNRGMSIMYRGKKHRLVPLSEVEMVEDDGE